jgi:hypothetical protein
MISPHFTSRLDTNPSRKYTGDIISHYHQLDAYKLSSSGRHRSVATELALASDIFEVRLDGRGDQRRGIIVNRKDRHSGLAFGRRRRLAGQARVAVDGGIEPGRGIIGELREASRRVDEEFVDDRAAGHARELERGRDARVARTERGEVDSREPTRDVSMTDA